MAQQTKATLGGYFEAGDTPTAANFGELISSSLNLAETTNQSVTGSVEFTANTSMRITTAVVNGDADLTLTEATHAGRTVMQTDVSADRTYTIPAPSAAGVKYHFVGQGEGSSADGHDILLKTTDNTEFFDGAITFLDTDNEVSGIWGNTAGATTLTISDS